MHLYRVASKLLKLIRIFDIHLSRLRLYPRKCIQQRIKCLRSIQTYRVTGSHVEIKFRMQIHLPDKTRHRRKTQTNPNPKKVEILSRRWKNIEILFSEWMSLKRVVKIMLENIVKTSSNASRTRIFRIFWHLLWPFKIVLQNVFERQKQFNPVLRLLRTLNRPFFRLLNYLTVRLKIIVFSHYELFSFLVAYDHFFSFLRDQTTIISKYFLSDRR